MSELFAPQRKENWWFVVRSSQEQAAECSWQRAVGSPPSQGYGGTQWAVAGGSGSGREQVRSQLSVTLSGPCEPVAKQSEAVLRKARSDWGAEGSAFKFQL